jgi:DNA-binding transcriptional LysR family regulator
MAMVDWLGVEPRHLEGVVAVSREGSFRRAAQRLGLAQSALSERIAQLEQLLGARLVKRSRGRAHVAFTDAGTTLVEHAEDILAELDAAADVRGVGAAVMPRLAVNDNDPRVTIVGLDGVLPPRRVVLYWHRDRRETAEIMRFLAALEASG